MSPQEGLWMAYLVGAILTLVWKWFRSCWYETKKSNVSMKDATLQWFFEASAANTTSWVTTFGIVWAFGAVYIDQVTWSWFSWVGSIPANNAIAFLMGSLMEMLAPAVVKLVASKIPFASALNVLKGDQKDV